MTRETNNAFEQSRAFEQECRLQQRIGMPGSRAYERAVRAAVEATHPMVEHCATLKMLYGSPRVTIDAAGAGTVETILPPEITQRVDSMVDAVQGIRDSIFKAELGHTD